MHARPLNDDRLRILMVNYEYPPWGGGSGNATRCVMEELARRPDVRVELLTSGAPGAEATEALAEHVLIHRVPIRKGDPHFWTSREIAGWLIGAGRRARALAATSRYEAIHCWGGWPAGLVGYRHRGRLPYLVGLRGSDVPGYNPRLRVLDPLVMRPLSRAIWRRAACVTCVSTDLRNLARRTAPDVLYEVIRNGVDTARFRPAARPERLTVLFVGRLIMRKGLMDLVEAFAEVAAEHPEPLLTLAGGGPDRKLLESAAHRAGVADRVRFLGPVAPEETPALYRSASVFVMPSLEEAMSNAVLEAMASGLPVITTPTGISEVVDGNGIVVDRQRPDQIAKAIRRYLARPALVDRHGRRSRAIAERMTWEKVAAAYVRLYERIAGRRADRVALDV